MEKIKQHLSALIKPYLSLEEDKIQTLLERPKKASFGLFSLPLFSVSKNPKKLADRMAQELKAEFIDRVSAVGGFVNFHIKDCFMQYIFNETFKNSNWWCSKLGSGQKIVMDYSSPNVAKYMNVGHLRATVIGQSLVNMACTQGYSVTALNHLGDWGTQFGKLIAAYKKWGGEISLPRLSDLYVKFHEEANDVLNKEARQFFLEMEDGKHLDLWSQFVDVSLKEYDSVWKRLGVSHDLVRGESFYKDKTKRVENILKQKKLLEKSEGARVVFVKDGPPCLIQKSDGASTYSARDLASVFYRFEELKSDWNIYVTGVDHSLHFKQLNQVLQKINPNWAEKTLHLSFGMYRFKGEGRLSSREGKTVSLSALMDEAQSRALKIIQEKNPSLADKEEVSEIVGIGSLIFNDLINDRVKDIDFSWDKILDFEGNSGPYVQYSYVRCMSLLKKTDQSVEEYKGLKIQESLASEERQLIEALLEFETLLKVSFKKYKPHILAAHLLEISRVFSRFYKNCRIIDSSQKDFRIELVKASAKVISKGLELLNIKTPHAM